MAINITNLIAEKSTTPASSYNTSSISPAANNLILLAVTARRADSTQPVAPTVTGNGLTWVKIAEIAWDTGGTSRKNTFLFRAMGASPSPGAVTINFGTQNITLPNWEIDQASGVDTSGTNGSGAVVQSAVNKDETNASVTVTLAAFGNANNATYGAFASDDNTLGGFTAGSGFTRLSTIDGSTTTAGGTEWKTANDTTVDGSFSTTAIGGIAIEIRAAPTIALTGTATASITETDIVNGGKTIILTITGDTWVASGATFDAQRQNIINGLDSAQAEATGWDAEVKAKIPVTDVVRTSDTVVTITLSAEAGYNITATETITATIPATALTGGVAVVASPTFTVDPVTTSTYRSRPLALLGIG